MRGGLNKMAIFRIFPRDAGCREDGNDDIMSSQMKLLLNGIEVECVIGERDDERLRLQRLRVDLVLEIPDDATQSDALEDTVDYAELTELIRATLTEAKCRMIERAARLVAEVCIRDPRVRSVEAHVTKHGAIPHLESATAVYTVDRRSDLH